MPRRAKEPGAPRGTFTSKKTLQINEGGWSQREGARGNRGGGWLRGTGFILETQCPQEGRPRFVVDLVGRMHLGKGASQPLSPPDISFQV